MCILYSYKHFILTKNWTLLKKGHLLKIVSKLKKKNIEGGGSNKNHYILTVPQETQRSLFSQKTLNIADPQSSSSDPLTLTIETPPGFRWVQKTQTAALRSGRSCSSDRTMACLTLMIVTPHTHTRQCDGLTVSCWARAHSGKAYIW